MFFLIERILQSHHPIFHSNQNRSTTMSHERNNKMTTIKHSKIRLRTNKKWKKNEARLIRLYRCQVNRDLFRIHSNQSLDDCQPNNTNGLVLPNEMTSIYWVMACGLPGNDRFDWNRNREYASTHYKFSSICRIINLRLEFAVWPTDCVISFTPAVSFDKPEADAKETKKPRKIFPFLRNDRFGKRLSSQSRCLMVCLQRDNSTHRMTYIKSMLIEFVTHSSPNGFIYSQHGLTMTVAPEPHHTPCSIRFGHRVHFDGYW